MGYSFSSFTSTTFALRFGRLWWILRRVLQALMERYVQPEEGADDRWTQPVVAGEDYALGSRQGVGGAEMSKNRTWPREGSFGDAGAHSASRYRLSS
jgi:hypothetical protein